MDINKLALFVDVADTKNFTKSGEHMGYTQPGVSHNLKVLEAELGFPLFLRTKQGIVLTPNAEAILPLVRKLLYDNELLQQTVHSINGLDMGRLTVATFSSVSRNWLPKIIRSFRETYPGIDIELLEGGSDDITSWVESGRADFGILSHRSIKNLKWISLMEDPLVAIFPKDYETDGMNVFPIAKMDRQPFIISADGVDYDIHFALDDAKIKPNICFSSKDDHAIVSMVANHLGLSILPELVIRGMENQILALPLYPFYSREIGIAMRPDVSLTPAAKQFVSTVQSQLLVQSAQNNFKRS